MFEKTLLDSSTDRAPTLRPVHWLISLAAGALGFAAASLLLPVASIPGATRILLLRAAVLGAALAVYALAVCYTYSDARREGFHRWFWPGFVILANIPGFFVYLAYSAMKTGDWKRATVPMAYTVEVFVVGLAALVPLIYTQALPAQIRMIVTPVPGAPRGNPSPAKQPPQRGKSHAVRTDILVTPPRIPQHIPDFSRETPLPPDIGTGIGVIGAPPGLGTGQDPTLISILSPQSALPPAPPKPAAVKRVKKGGEVEAALAVFTPPPLYPPIAIRARVQGTVRIHAIIGADGTVQELKVISGNPLLVNAARDAVARWRYKPTLLNREPVEVDTEIDVNFVLND
jgi:protein TonB